MNKDKRDLLTLAILSYAKRATRDQKSPEGTKRALGDRKSSRYSEKSRVESDE